MSTANECRRRLGLETEDDGSVDKEVRRKGDGGERP